MGFAAMLDLILGVIFGMGVGAYNHQHLRPCLEDTFHLSKQKAVPVAKNMSNKVAEKASPYVQDLKDKASPYVKDMKDKASPYLSKAQGNN